GRMCQRAHFCYWEKREVNSIFYGQEGNQKCLALITKSLNNERSDNRDNSIVYHKCWFNRRLIETLGDYIEDEVNANNTIPEVGLIFISNTSPDTFYSSNMGYVEPIPVYFPDYTDADLCKILSRNQADSKLYSSFLDVALRSFFRVTRQVDELSTAFKPLYEKYCEPLSDKRVFPNGDKDKDMKRKLFSHINPHITSSLNEIFKVSSHPSAEVENSKEANLKVNQKKPERREEIAKLDFHMSTSAKYLLILAFLASRNPATLDASLFDSKGGSDNRYRSTVSEDLALKLTAPLSSLLAFLCQNHPGSSARCPVSHVQGGSIKTAIQAGSALAFTSALIDFRGQRIKHDSHKEYAAYNSALMKTIKGATTGLISGTIWVLLLPPGIMFLVLRETLLFRAS
ncbi:hypothetical protein S245_049267, partial [Arachis hypogaea]